jgi:hypothetical protein
MSDSETIDAIERVEHSPDVWEGAKQLVEARRAGTQALAEEQGPRELPRAELAKSA